MGVPEVGAWRVLAERLCTWSGASPTAPPDVIAEGALGAAGPARYAAIVGNRLGRRELLEVIESARAALDQDLRAPAPWRGSTRRDIEAGRSRPAAWLAAGAPAANGAGRPADPDDLLAWNRRVGAPGEWRTRAMTVDGFTVPFSPTRSRQLVDSLLEAAAQSRDPAAVTACRLHLGLLLAHPFRDGNGRTARLAAARVLMDAGMRSSLLTCVEHHGHATPARYRSMLVGLRRREISVDDAIDELLSAMAGRVVLAGWMRRRHAALFSHAVAVDGEDPVEVLWNFERGAGEPTIDRGVVWPIEPWCRLRPHLRPRVARELRSQLAGALGDVVRAGTVGVALGDVVQAGTAGDRISRRG